MFGKHETDVLVVGAGPVGLFAALSLVHRGLRVEIIDEGWRPTMHSYAAAFHPRSLSLLDRVGVLEAALARSIRIDHVVFYDAAAPRAAVRFADLPVAHPFAAVLRQDVIENLLEEQLAERGVRVQWNHRLHRLRPAENFVTAEIDELEKMSCGYAVATAEWDIRRSKTTKAAFVIGADGYRSMVRRELGIEYPLIGQPDLFAVFEFETETDPGKDLSVVLSGTSSVMWPLPGRAGRWSFQVSEGEPTLDARDKNRLTVQVDSRSFPSLAREELALLMRERAPWFHARIDDVRWSILVRFERRLADRFGYGRCWLVGDAGHMASPIGVQSMNVGIREADEVVTLIDRNLRGSSKLEAFDAYEAGRRREWGQLLQTDGASLADHGAAPWVRENQARILGSIPAAGNDLAALLEQLHLGFKHELEPTEATGSAVAGR
ncbi:MAG: NAD(P)/FAD-dependent oxidoreductase [Phycisphaerae bacterium]